MDKEDFITNLIHLRYFVELAHTHHYTRTAEKLCITQPSLSYAISQLESDLGIPLFEKSGRNTTLTHFGEQFLSYAENALQILDNGVEMMQKSAKGEGSIRLGMVRPAGVSFIPNLAHKFLKQNPDKDIRFEFGCGTTPELIKRIHAQHYDLIFCSDPNTEVGLTSKIIFQQDMILIVPLDHPLVQYDSVDLEQTLLYPYVYFSKDSGLRYEVDSLFEVLGKRPKIAHEILEDEVVAGLVAHGFGIAVVPKMDILSNLNVKTIQISNPIRYRNIHMVHNNRVYMAPLVREFRNFVIQECSLN